MSNAVAFTDEPLERSVRRRAEYDESNPRDLVLSVAKRNGGTITIPLLSNAHSNIEREDYQDNTMLRIKPLATVRSDLPVSSGFGAPVYQGKGVALLRPGYLYVFRGDILWRELEVDTFGRVSDIDLGAFRAGSEGAGATTGSQRPAEGEWLNDVLVPVFMQGRAVMHETRMAYSEVQWDWQYIQRLEADSRAREARTTGVGHAWAVTSVDSLSFEGGFPASRIEDVVELRARDLGVELILESPSDFVPGFERPSGAELFTRLADRIRQNQPQSGEAIDLELKCGPGKDLLARFREQKGVVCVALPDPMFTLRHSLAQLHLALHYLDAVDVSLQNRPMAHSAMLIRQAVLDPRPDGRPSPLSRYASAIDRDKLDEVLDTLEKDHAIRIIDNHTRQICRLLETQTLTAALEDYRECRDVAIGEAYLLIADSLNVLQQIPGVVRAHGRKADDSLFLNLKNWLTDVRFLSAWAPEEPIDGSDSVESSDFSAFEKLAQLTQSQTEIDEKLLDRLNLQSLAYLEKQLQQKKSGNNVAKDVSSAGKVGGLIAGALSEWSTAILSVCRRLMEQGAIQQVELQRVMQAAVSNFALADPDLKGIQVMSRAGAEVNGSILGVSSEGLNRGLTNFDRTEGVLTRAKDYLYADLVDGSGQTVASTSPARAVDEVEEAVGRIAGGTLVFFVADGHEEAAKLSLLKVDFAKRVGKVVDGPAVSRGLVVLAGFNLFVEAQSVWKAWKSNPGDLPLALAKTFAGAGADLVAASLKLSQVLGDLLGSSGETTRMYRVATRPLFDVKSVLVIGARLQKLGAPTLVRTVGLASFAAGAVGVVISSWEMRLSLSNKDYDAATGHAIAMVGGTIFLATPMMGALLGIPGWGWAIFGMALVVGGGMYAGAVTDDSFEKLIKRGPWGVFPNDAITGSDDKAYYSQLISLLSPVNITAQTYAHVDPDPALSHPDYSPDPDDYVITVQLPLISRLKLSRECQSDLPVNAFNLVVQEVAYMSSSANAVGPGAMMPATTTYLLKTTPLTKVIARQSLPHQSAVRFLVKREFRDREYRSFLYQESVTTAVRVGLQAILETEVGHIVFPAPVHENFEPFDLLKHGNPPPKARTVLNPHDQPNAPYWYFSEVTT